MTDASPIPRTPTLQDVARAAGVSTATVSRCLNFPDQVTDKTREKVQSAIDDLGYLPNFGARVMASNRTNTVAAIIPTMDNALFASGIQAFQEELAREGFTLLVASSNYDAQTEHDQIKTLAARGADAVLLIGFARDDAVYRFLDQQALPYLVAWAYDAKAAPLSVGYDNRAAMQAMARRVLDLGHTRLGLISAPTHNNDRTAMRLAGAQAAVAEAGLPEAALQVIETPYGFDTGAAAFEQMMRCDAPPTAVLCANDVLAVGALQAAQRLGLSVPDDVSIIGFDDIPLAQVAQPPLTTVRVPLVDMGRRAAHTLVQMVAGNSPQASVMLPTEIKERGTLAPPKRS